MKIVVISDTHGLHGKLTLPEGDLIIHAGDVSNLGEEKEVENFIRWFKELDFEYKVFIAGNHDFLFETASDEEIMSLIPEGIVYLQDNGVNINGINIWGSPITPWFGNWAFNRLRGDNISRHWELIPGNTDILITHGPAFRILDKTISGYHAGCKDLLLNILNIKPKVHIFGHIHESYGCIEKHQVKFINASILNERYEMVNKPLLFEL